MSYLKLWERFWLSDLFSKSSSFGKIEFDNEKCTGCGLCVRICPGNILMLDENKKPSPNTDMLEYTGGTMTCASCGACMAACPKEAAVITDHMHLGGKFKSLRRGPVAKPRLFSELAEK